MKTPIHEFLDKLKSRSRSRQFRLNYRIACREIAAELEAALAEAPAAEQQWQPIETAPKDGTEILVGFDAGSVWVVHVAWWRELEKWMQDDPSWSEDDIGWWSYTRNATTQEKLCGYLAPTHWMTLPPAPTPKSHD